MIPSVQAQHVGFAKGKTDIQLQYSGPEKLVNIFLKNKFIPVSYT
jgi:hypothetical protein